MKNNMKKQQIIEHGLNLFRIKGFNGTGISEILKQAKIPKGSFYYYFTSKENFTVEVLKYYSGNLVNEINNFLTDTSNSPIVRIKRLYSKHIKNYINDTHFPYGAFASKICQEIGEEHEPIFRVSNKLFHDIKEAHVKCLKEAQEANEITSTVNVEKIAELILYSWEGAILRMKVNRSFESLYIFQEMLDKIILNNSRVLSEETSRKMILTD